MDATVNAKPSAPRLHFEPFTLDLHRAELTRAGVPVALRPKAMTLLKHLVASAGRAVSKEELIDAVWPDAVVTDDSLTQCMAELRAALGDRGQQIIKTLPRVGYRFDVPVRLEGAAASAPAASPGPDVRAPAGPRRRTAVWAASMAIGALLVVGLVLGLAPSKTPAPPRIDDELAARRSIAVMPFTDLSEPAAPHVAQAVDMDLITDLGRLGDIKVISRASTALLGARGDLDVKRIGRELDVRHVLTGSVQRNGERLAITVQLARADSGALLWTERFEYASAADWSARRGISAQVANLLDTKVHETAIAPGRHKLESDAAVDHWMRGSYLMSRFTTHAEVLQARLHFDAALAAQPDSVQALAGLAATHVCEVLYGWSKDRASSLATAKELARRALQIDPYNQWALAVLSGALQFVGELDDAMVVTRKQLAANPNDAHANRDLASVLYLSGRWGEALSQLDIALRLNPLDRSHLWKCHSIASSSLIALGRYDEAVVRARLGIAADPAVARPHFNLAAALAQLGDVSAAKVHLADALKLRPGSTVASGRASALSQRPAFLAGMERYEAGLRLAGLPEGPAPAGTSSSVAVR